jgi:carboxyl-terminal processing protease
MRKKIKVLGIGLAVCCALVAFKPDDRLFEIAKNLEVFATLYKELNSLYVDEINPTKAMRAGINAMLKDLDPYTVFYPEDEIEDYFTMNTGSYNGIGANVELHEKQHLIVMIYEGSPADKAGLKIGDEIRSINGVDIINRNTAEFGRLLKGQKGTQVKLGVFRKGSNKKMDFSVARDVIKTPNVPHTGIVKDDIGYIQLTEFSATAAKEIKTAMMDLKAKGMKKLILDLRGNGGGLLNQAIEICNFFIPKGQLVVETKGKVKEWNQKYNTMQEPTDLEMPIVVLINGRSASASEIVSGTLQDYDRGVLIGSRSFGKGLVQLTKPLSYNTSFKVTTSKYYIPSGRCIQAIDYGNRSEDGTVTKLPDSLRTLFKTKGGRPVLDGAGVDPDIVSSLESVSDYTKSLIKQKLIFEYANDYYFKNQNNKPAENFSLGAADIEKFEIWLSTQNNTYKTAQQKHIEAYINAAKADGDFTKIKNHAEELLRIANAEASNLAKKNRNQIKKELEAEILMRFYYQKVMKFSALEKDEDIIKAIEVLNNPVRYKQILGKK